MTENLFISPKPIMRRCLLIHNFSLLSSALPIHLCTHPFLSTSFISFTCSCCYCCYFTVTVSKMVKNMKLQNEEKLYSWHGEANEIIPPLLLTCTHSVCCDIYTSISILVLHFNIILIFIILSPFRNHLCQFACKSIFIIF